MLKTILAGTAALSLAAAPAIAADHHKSQDKKGMSDEAMMMKDKKTIAGKAMETKQLSTLVTAVKAADLTSTLEGEGPYTVFAPTNDGFAAISDTVNTLLEPANKDQLQRVLKAHVVAAELTAAELMLLAKANGGMVKVDTVAGDVLTVNAQGSDLTITDENGGTATIVMKNVEAENGIVHVVDAVLVPQV